MYSLNSEKLLQYITRSYQCYVQWNAFEIINRLEIIETYLSAFVFIIVNALCLAVSCAINIVFCILRGWHLKVV